MPKKDIQLRLAFRTEGHWWNCYVAEVGSIEKAFLIGSIAMRAAAVPAIKDQFVETMKAAFSVAIEQIGAGNATWPNPMQAAPEHERAGRA